MEGRSVSTSTARLSAATLVLMLAVGCGGNGDGSDPSPAPTATSTPAPTHSPRPAQTEPPVLDGGTQFTAGQVIFVNDCQLALNVFANDASIGTIQPTDTLPIPISQFNQGAANAVMAYPVTSATQCPAAYCDGWTDLGGPPGTVQREGFMWQDGSDPTYATYCNPNLSGSGEMTCQLQDNCCGPNMVLDGTYGTLWEFTPAGGDGNDYPDLSTNYGTGPMSPPALCPAGGGTDCVSETANIFFNIPVAWSTNEACSFTSQDQQVMSLQCLTVDCADAYQTPTDDKQCACPTSATRGYLVVYCPMGTSLPAPPGGF